MQIECAKYGATFFYVVEQAVEYGFSHFRQQCWNYGLNRFHCFIYVMNYKLDVTAVSIHYLLNYHDDHAWQMNESCNDVAAPDEKSINLCYWWIKMLMVHAKLQQVHPSQFLPTQRWSWYRSIDMMMVHRACRTVVSGTNAIAPYVKMSLKISMNTHDDHALWPTKCGTKATSPDGNAKLPVKEDPPLMRAQSWQWAPKLD